MIGGGRAPCRAVLFTSALTATRGNSPFRSFYDRLVAAGKPKMVALIAVARKILTIANAILRTKNRAARLTNNTVAEEAAPAAVSKDAGSRCGASLTPPGSSSGPT